MTKFDERVLQIIKKRFGYNNEEIEEFGKEPRNIELGSNYLTAFYQHSRDL